MTDTPPFDPPYYSVERTAQGWRVTETTADGSQKERMVAIADAVGLLAAASSTLTASSTTRSVKPKNAQSTSGMPPGATLISVPFAEKDAAKKLGARWDAQRRSWYVPPGTDVSLFRRWRTDEADA